MLCNFYQWMIKNEEEITIVTTIKSYILLYFWMNLEEISPRVCGVC